jgi:hypothetical protein
MDRVIFGDNQFFAVNHMSDDKARQQAMQFKDDKDIIRVLDHAYDAGIKTFMCTTHDRIANIANHIRQNPARYPDFKFYPCMPYAHKYANAVTERGFVGALQYLVTTDVLNLSAKLGKAIATRDIYDVMKVLVDLEMRMFKGLKVEVVFLQNVVTDLILGLGMPHLFSAFNRYISEEYNAEAGFITMNLPALLHTLDEEGIKNPIVCASYNISGFRMPGGIQSYDQALEKYQCRFIAMQVLAAGALSAAEAINSVAAKAHIDSILFGASSFDHITHTKKLIESVPKEKLSAKKPSVPLKIDRSLTSLKQCNQYLAHFNDENGINPCVVFEAGGGSFSHFVRPQNSQLVTLDILASQLMGHKSTNHKIQGDLHKIPLLQNSINQIICFNVIEHLENPDCALNEMWKALKPGGILILGFPDRNSLKGLITRVTPTWFHRMYYRYVVKKFDSGDGHFDVFSTTFAKIVSGEKIKEWLATQNMSLLFYSAYDGAKEFELTKGSLLRQMFAVPYYGCAFLGRLISMGKWQATHSDILLIAQKR